MASKPRTNDDALRLFADNLASNEVGPHITVNSIMLEGDTIYHYGHHYPMAKIVRKTPKRKTTPGWRANDAPGPVLAVHVNSTRWGGASGWGSSTDSVVCTLRGYLRGYGVEIIETPLTSGNLSVLVENVEGDDMPVIPELNIPPCPKTNVPTDPGPEPVKDPAGCIAGTTFEAPYQSIEYDFGYSPSTAHPVAPSISNAGTERERRTERYSVWAIERVYFGESSYRYGEKNIPAEHDYKQCPHCRAHDVIRERWRVQMYGGYGRGSGMGWKQYDEQCAIFGDPETWAIARSALMTMRKRRQKALGEWMGRNSMAHGQVPTVRVGNVTLPVIDSETGRVTRAVLLKAERQRKRADARRRKELRERRKREAEAEAERQRKLDEMRARLKAGEMVDDTVPTWLADNSVTITEDGLHAILYKRIHRKDGELVSYYDTSFIWEVGKWAIADDYLPTAECGNGLHFAETGEGAARMGRHYGDIIIECKVPIAGIVNMHQKVKAERAFVLRIVNTEEG